MIKRTFPKFKMLLVLVAVAALALTAIGSLSAKEANTAKVTFLKGKVEARKGATGEWQPIAKGSELGAKYVVKTGKDSRLELKLPDGSVLRISAKAKVRLKSLIGKKKKKGGKTDFKVTTGKIWANVSKAIGGEKKFEVSTNNAVAGVRGTIFRVSATETATVVNVYAGSVAVSNAPIMEKKIDKKAGRTQVAGPKQVSKKQFEQIIAKEMQRIVVDARGRLSMTDFTKASEKEDDWVQWNEERDKLALVPIPKEDLPKK